ncbi:EamA family transporter [Neomegalonema sp.]|uniref:DMT family transporter n=1 Tax=Neomegalonema sp. TaxID=2039713 RepID=UPI00262A6DD5|nr:EamA family transporter [Neomegalonema sp.]MDD2869420.1 EamA family transporter [Neomegalonema sp.]
MRGPLTLDAMAPVLFVLLWSTGFVGAKYGLPYAGPMTFLALRFALVIAGMGLWTLLSRAPWPTRRQWGHLAVIGLTVQLGYLGGVFAAIHLGLESGVSALIVSLQPILSAILAKPMLGETLHKRQWLGLALGLAGVALVVSNKLAAGVGDWRGVGLCLIALACMTFGTLWQKKYGANLPLRSGAVAQYAVALVGALALAFLFETREVRWTGEFVFALFWLAAALSFGAIALLYRLLRTGAASRATSLFFMVPPVAAFWGWAFFGETLGPTALLGFVLAAAGVALAMRPQPKHVEEKPAA